jgi:hypothetical protein
MDPLVVGLACGDICLRDQQRSVLAKPVDTADVIGVTLSERDVARRRGAHRVVVALVGARFEPHAGVHDDAAVFRRDQVAARHPRRAPDPLSHVDRLG